MNLEDLFKKHGENPDEVVDARKDSNEEAMAKIKKSIDHLDDYDAFLICVSKDGNVQNFQQGNPVEVAYMANRAEANSKKIIDKLPDELKTMCILKAMLHANNDLDD